MSSSSWNDSCFFWFAEREIFFFFGDYILLLFIQLFVSLAFNFKFPAHKPSLSLSFLQALRLGLTPRRLLGSTSSAATTTLETGPRVQVLYSLLPPYQLRTVVVVLAQSAAGRGQVQEPRLRKYMSFSEVRVRVRVGCCWAGVAASASVSLERQKKKESASIKNSKDGSAAMEPTKSPTGRPGIWVYYEDQGVDECPIIDTSKSAKTEPIPTSSTSIPAQPHSYGKQDYHAQFSLMASDPQLLPNVLGWQDLGNRVGVIIRHINGVSGKQNLARMKFYVRPWLDVYYCRKE